ncbi:MAG: hypothetical protein PHS88_11440, partial [Candidatus Omnitrophica bacterium]|nr:hypothetical protein [Candidatus Omnitrophota bacterium]
MDEFEERLQRFVWALNGGYAWTPARSEMRRFLTDKQIDEISDIVLPQLSGMVRGIDELEKTGGGIDLSRLRQQLIRIVGEVGDSGLNDLTGLLYQGMEFARVATGDEFKKELQRMQTVLESILSVSRAEKGSVAAESHEMLISGLNAILTGIRQLKDQGRSADLAQLRTQVLEVVSSVEDRGLNDAAGYLYTGLDFRGAATMDEFEERLQRFVWALNGGYAWTPVRSEMRMTQEEYDQKVNAIWQGAGDDINTPYREGAQRAYGDILSLVSGVARSSPEVNLFASNATAYKVLSSTILHTRGNAHGAMEIIEQIAGGTPETVGPNIEDYQRSLFSNPTFMMFYFAGRLMDKASMDELAGADAPFYEYFRDKLGPQYVEAEVIGTQPDIQIDFIGGVVNLVLDSIDVLRRQGNYDRALERVDNLIAHGRNSQRFVPAYQRTIQEGMDASLALRRQITEEHDHATATKKAGERSEVRTVGEGEVQFFKDPAINREDYFLAAIGAAPLEVLWNASFSSVIGRYNEMLPENRRNFVFFLDLYGEEIAKADRDLGDMLETFLMDIADEKKGLEPELPIRAKAQLALDKVREVLYSAPATAVRVNNVLPVSPKIEEMTQRALPALGQQITGRPEAVRSEMRIALPPAGQWQRTAARREVPETTAPDLFEIVPVTAMLQGENGETIPYAFEEQRVNANVLVNRIIRGQVTKERRAAGPQGVKVSTLIRQAGFPTVRLVMDSAVGAVISVEELDQHQQTFKKADIVDAAAIGLIVRTLLQEGNILLNAMEKSFLDDLGQPIFSLYQKALPDGGGMVGKMAVDTNVLANKIASAEKIEKTVKATTVGQLQTVTALTFIIPTPYPTSVLSRTLVTIREGTGGAIEVKEVGPRGEKLGDIDALLDGDRAKVIGALLEKPDLLLLPERVFLMTFMRDIESRSGAGVQASDTRISMPVTRLVPTPPPGMREPAARTRTEMSTGTLAAIIGKADQITISKKGVLATDPILVEIPLREGVTAPPGSSGKISLQIYSGEGAGIAVTTVVNDVETGDAINDPKNIGTILSALLARQDVAGRSPPVLVKALRDRQVLSRSETRTFVTVEGLLTGRIDDRWTDRPADAILNTSDPMPEPTRAEAADDLRYNYLTQTGDGRFILNQAIYPRPAVYQLKLLRIRDQAAKDFTRRYQRTPGQMVRINDPDLQAYDLSVAEAAYEIALGWLAFEKDRLILTGGTPVDFLIHLNGRRRYSSRFPLPANWRNVRVSATVQRTVNGLLSQVSDALFDRRIGDDAVWASLLNNMTSALDRLPKIADANGLEEVLSLIAGTRLWLPDVRELDRAYLALSAVRATPTVLVPPARSEMRAVTQANVDAWKKSAQIQAMKYEPDSLSMQEPGVANQTIPVYGDMYEPVHPEDLDASDAGTAFKPDEILRRIGRGEIGYAKGRFFFLPEVTEAVPEAPTTPVPPVPAKPAAAKTLGVPAVLVPAAPLEALVLAARQAALERGRKLIAQLKQLNSAAIRVYATPQLTALVDYPMSHEQEITDGLGTKFTVPLNAGYILGIDKSVKLLQWYRTNQPGTNVAVYDSPEARTAGDAQFVSAEQAEIELLE